MTASYRSGAATESYSLPTVTKTKPAGTAEGDVVFAAFVTNDASRTLNTIPNGWSIIANAGDATSPGGRMWIAKKKAGASEPASYDFTFNYEFNGLTAIWSVKDGDDVSAIGAARTDAPLSHPYSVQADSIGVPDDDSLLIWVGGQRITTTGVDPVITQPAGFDLRIDGGVEWEVASLFIADKVQASAGASGAATGSVSRAGAGNGRSFGVLLAISPAGGGSTIPAAGEPMLPVITSVAVDATTVSLTAGNYADITLTVSDQDGDPIRYLDGAHTSSAPAIATAAQLAATDAAGRAMLRITGVAAGSTTITCDFDGVACTIGVTVVSLAQPVRSVLPASVVMSVGETQQFAFYVDGGAQNATWTVETGGGAITQGGLYTAPSVAGAATVRAASPEDPGVYSEATVTIIAATGRVIVPFTRNGRRYSNQSLDYIVKAADNTIVAFGVGMTDDLGVLTITVPGIYIGQYVLLIVDNVGPDMDTTGRVKRILKVLVT